MTIADGLATDGYAVLPQLVDEEACAELHAFFDDGARFRKTVIMERVGFGRGTYKYFAAPLPPLVARLREELYTALLPVANDWAEALGVAPYPPTLGEMLERCAAHGQTRPTPLLLRYRAGDHNALHQDLYGEISFPLQATVLLDAPERDFRGGEFVLVEQRPRKQSLVHVVQMAKGDAVVFPNAVRPIRGGRGFYRTRFRHGVSQLHAGGRLTLGLIFHDAS